MELDSAAMAGGGHGPDVSVVVPVYNTRPYLTRCLASLAEQSIGFERMEVIAVDDGSTDGSGAELDRFARRYPGAVTVIHQANSGGPAGPCNRGLERATGRYVFFLGADDYLGREALERMVAAADRYSSDVVLGKMVGVNNRFSSQAIFARTAPDVGLFDSPLPFSLANTKLFRRELIEQYRLRHPEDMPMGSDQPFTLEACFRARRISVLADYDYYYIVRRLDAGNITYSSAHERRLHSLQSIMTFVAELVEPGQKRDAVLLRHFSWEAAKLLGDDLLGLDRSVQERVKAGVAGLVERYLTNTIRDQLEVEARVRLSIARHASLDDLLSVIRQDAHGGVPPTVVDDGRWYAGYPGFRDPHLSLPDSWFDVTDHAPGWTAKLDATAITWESAGNGARELAITARSPLSDLAALCSGEVFVCAGPVAGKTTMAAAPDGTGTVVRTRFSVGELLADTTPLGGRRSLRTLVSVSGITGSAPLRAPGIRLPLPVVSRQGARLYAVSPRLDPTGHLVVTVVPVTPRRIVAGMRRRWSRARGSH